MKTPKPSELGLDHDEWRPGQWDAVKFTNGLKAGEIGIIEAPTGSGKTGIVSASSVTRPTVALMNTRNEQRQFGRYDFDILFGKANYACSHVDAAQFATANDCLHKDEGMNKCAFANGCAYLLARDAAMASKRAALNYALWARFWPGNWPAPDLMVMDEGHDLPALVRERAGVVITQEMRDQYQFGQPPLLAVRKDGITWNAADSDNTPLARAMIYLRSTIRPLESAIDTYERNSKQATSRKELQAAQSLLMNVKTCISAIEMSQSDWFVECLPANNWQFTVKPLTARHHFQRMMVPQSAATMIMSGTIGNFDVFADELGIHTFQSHTVPSVWDAKVRPVYDLCTPQMGMKADESDKEEQAKKIADVIRACDRKWNGIVLTTSKVAASELARRLTRKGLGDRVYVANEKLGTDRRVVEWQEQMERKPGSINVSWDMWQAYDGVQEKILVVAKAPYGSLSSEYDQQRIRYSGALYAWEAAQKLAQGIGRTRRGNPEDYDTPTEKRGMVAIADNGWLRLKKYIPQHVLLSILPW